MSKLDIPARERVIVALDLPHLAALKGYLAQLEGLPAIYKIGLELYTAEGAWAIEAVKRAGGRVFLDLKLHDIPATVARTVRVAADRYDVEMMTLHVPGGLRMMSEAVAAAREKRPELKLLGVTVLTSLQESDLKRDEQTCSLETLVGSRARAAAAAGLQGLVCSPQEVDAVKADAPDLLAVVPGIRPAGAALGDQKRVATPAEAIVAGADYIVVGRPIRDAESPIRTFNAIAAEVEGALARRAAMS